VWVGVASPLQVDFECPHGVVGIGFPFEVLRALLAGLVAPSGLPALALAVGGRGDFAVLAAA
jgi:hypothetical protein